MIVDESIANISNVVEHLRSSDPTFTDATPVIGMPMWFLDEVREAFGAGPDELVDEIHGIKIIQREELSEPVVISGGGQTFPVLPGWARAANVGKVS